MPGAEELQGIHPQLSRSGDFPRACREPHAGRLREGLRPQADGSERRFQRAGRHPDHGRGALRRIASPGAPGFLTFEVPIRREILMPKIHNFSPGPSILPRQAMEAGSRACLDFNGTGLSLLEMSHRGKDFIAVMDQAVALVKELLGVPSGYLVLFLQGGASMQFAMVPYNLLD